MHSGEKPYQCGICARSFRSLNTLKHHVTAHTGGTTDISLITVYVDPNTMQLPDGEVQEVILKEEDLGGNQETIYVAEEEQEAEEW